MGKIFIGEWDKKEEVKKYLQNNDIDKVYIIGDDLEIDYPVEHEHIKFADTIMYKYFYRLLQEINKKSLVILNECLRKQNRYDLTYNCIRRYMLQTPHRLIFNYFPIIKDEEDFMILYDMLQDNPFLKEPYKYITKFENVFIGKLDFEVTKTDIKIDEEQYLQYCKAKEQIINEVKKDPNIIPRRLLKFSQKLIPKEYDKLDVIKPIMNVAVTPLKVDQYYYNEILRFKEVLESVLQRIHQ